jgi:hypothetical protein
VFHLGLIVAVCLRDTFFIFRQSPTLFPRSFDQYWRKAEEVVGLGLGDELAISNPVRHAIAVYLNCAGIEGGYGFFAPNVPGNYKLVFELHYPDGHVDYELPHVASEAAALRLSSLLDRIAETTYLPLRQMICKMLTYSIWKQHPQAQMIRAVFGYVESPGPREFAKGEKESYHFLFAYDFSFRDEESVSPP